MSVKISVYLNKQNIPSLDDVLGCIRTDRYPLTCDESWGFVNDMGYLPCMWNGVETGCEFEAGKLSMQQKAHLKEAGFQGLDTEISATFYGDWTELRTASLFCRYIAELSGGCLSDEDDVYTYGEDLSDWLENVQAEAQRGIDSQSDIQPQILSQEEATNQLKDALSQMLGASIHQFITMDLKLALMTNQGFSIGSKAWTLTLEDGTVFSVGQYAKTKLRQLPLYAIEHRTLAQQKELDDLDEALITAADHDEATMSEAMTSIQAWPDQDLEIQSVRMVSEQRIDVTLSNQACLSYFAVGDIPTLSIALLASGQNYWVSTEGIETFSDS